MEIIPRSEQSHKDKLIWPPIDDVHPLDTQPTGQPDNTPEYVDPNVTNHLYGPDRTVEGGDIFVPGDFC